MIYFAADHGGFHLKEALKTYLEGANTGKVIMDLGPITEKTVDYPDMAMAMVMAMKENDSALGVLICGSGIGVSMAANRHRHIRAALVSEPLSAALSRQHNNANVLCLGGRLMGVTMAQACVDAFLSASFEGGRHAVRVSKFS